MPILRIDIHDGFSFAAFTVLSKGITCHNACFALKTIGNTFAQPPIKEVNLKQWKESLAKK